MTIKIYKKDEKWFVESPDFFSVSNEVLVKSFKNRDEAQKFAVMCAKLCFSSAYDH